MSWPSADTAIRHRCWIGRASCMRRPTTPSSWRCRTGWSVWRCTSSVDRRTPWPATDRPSTVAPSSVGSGDRRDPGAGHRRPRHLPARPWATRTRPTARWPAPARQAPEPARAGRRDALRAAAVADRAPQRRDDHLSAGRAGAANGPTTSRPSPACGSTEARCGPTGATSMARSTDLDAAERIAIAEDLPVAGRHGRPQHRVRRGPPGQPARRARGLRPGRGGLPPARAPRPG